MSSREPRRHAAVTPAGYIDVRRAVSAQVAQTLLCVAVNPVADMKEYRLAAWPQLRAPFDRIAHRRMLSDMSHRHMSMARLADASGISREEVRAFLAMLEARGLVVQREGKAPETRFGALRPLASWLRRAIAPARLERPKDAALRRPSPAGIKKSDKATFP